jgi:hypothetical protein
MATKLGPNKILTELDFLIDAGSEKSYPRSKLAPYWVDYAGSLAANRYLITGPDSIYIKNTYASWIGRFEAFMSSTEQYTIMFDHVSDAASSIVLDNDTVDDNQWNATISSSTTKQTYSFTRTPAQVSSTYRIQFYIRRNGGGNITISNFRFFKTSPAYDLIGSNNATLGNGTSYSGGDGIGSGVGHSSTDHTVGSWIFDGSNDKISIGAGTGLNQFSGDFTVSVWAKRITDNSSWGNLIGDYYTNTTATTNEWQIMMGPVSGSNTRLTLYRVGSGSIINQVSSGVANRTWTNVVVTRLGQTINMYSNGSVVGTATNTTTFGTSTGNLHIGIDGNGSSEPFNGEIAAVQISNGRGLSANEVLQDYKALKNRFI